MLYIDKKPAAPLDRAVRSIWYASVPANGAGRQRVLPTGRAQVILSLERDYLLDCAEDGTRRGPAAQVIGARSQYEIIDASDLECLIGIVFQPGGFPVFARDRADLFANRSVDLEDVWGSAARGLRDRLRGLGTPRERMACLEAFLMERLLAGPVDAGSSREAMVRFALERFGRAAGVSRVSEVARATGWSERRFSEIFREEVGLTPKVWCRVQRFQRAVRQLHAGAEMRWTELAVDCGFYDQAHFANEFRAFSGIDATTYVSGRRTPWANHVEV